MNIDQTLEQLARQQYPRQVDVVDRVMAQVEQHPYLQPRRRPLWQPIGAAAAACAALLLILNVATFRLRSYDEASMGVAIAQANDYASWNTVEDCAVNPYESLYEE